MSMEAFYQPEPNPNEVGAKLPKVPENDPDHIPNPPPMPGGPGPKAPGLEPVINKPIDLDQGTPEIVIKQPEEVPVAPADYLENDQRYKDLVNQAALEYLKTKDQVWFQKQGYTGVENGYLVGPGGKKDSPVTLLGGPGYMEAKENANKKFKEKYAVDHAVYGAREAIRTYEDPDRDPEYKRTENEILGQANLFLQNWQHGRSNITFTDSMAMQDSYKKSIGKEKWAEFAAKYPKKAEAYREKNTLIDEALKAVEEKKKQASEGVNSADKKNPDQAKDYLKARGYDEAYVDTLDESQADQLHSKSIEEDATQKDLSEKAPEQNANLKAMWADAEKMKQKKAEAPSNLPTSEKPPEETKKKEEPKEEKKVELKEEKAKETVSGDAAIEKHAKNPESVESKRNLAERFADKLGISSLIDSAKISFNGYITNWYDKKILDREKDYAEKKKNVAELEEDVKYLTEQAEILRKNPDVSEDNILDIESDRRKAESLLVRAREAEVEARLDVDRANISREGFIIRRDEACHSYIDRMKSELRPFENDISKLSSIREDFARGIKENEKQLQEYRDELEVYAADYEKSKPFPSVHRGYRDIVKKIEAEIDKYEKVIHEYEKGVDMVDAMVEENEKRAQPFKDKIDELRAVMKGKKPETPSDKPKEEKSFESVPGKTETQRKKSPGDMRPIMEFIEGWNAINGDKTPIDTKALKKALGGEYERNDLSIEEFWEAATLYTIEHGADMQMIAPPEAEEAERPKKKKKSLWQILFGLPESKAGKKRLSEYLKENPPAPKSNRTA